MAREGKNPTTKNQQTNDAGEFTCKVCGSPMVPMDSGKGFRCGKPGNVFNKKTWTYNLCQYVIWNTSRPTGRFAKQIVIPRPADFPTIDNPTDQQKDIRQYLSLSPKSRGGSRLTVINAGPGTGKTTTLSWTAQGIYERLGSLMSYVFCAFNRNARDVLLGKMPTEVSEIATLNGLGMRAQGFSPTNVKTGKLRDIFKGMVSHIPYKERPQAGCLPAVIERMRDLCLFSSDETDKAFWNHAIDLTIARFSSLTKRLQGEAEKIVREYLPIVAVQAFRDRSIVDFSEQYTRPVTTAIARLGWTIPDHLTTRSAQWTDEEVQHFATLIKSVDIAQYKGLVIDEAQDLSLVQVALFLAMTFRSGELTIIGDDARGEPEDKNYKAGQGIFGWRGSFPGSMTLVERLWQVLTGEQSKQFELSVSFRCPPEVVEAVKPLNKVLTSSKPVGSGRVFNVQPEQDFNVWCGLPEGKTALWLTRRNAPLATIFLRTIRERKQCTIRGGDAFEGQVDNALYQSAGWYDNDGEFRTPLDKCLAKLQEAIAEQSAATQEDGKQQEEPDSIESFLLEVGKAIMDDPNILREAGLLDTRGTVGNLRRFVLYFADRKSPRVLSTVYRAKGDEAHIVIVSDTDAMNTAWGGDEVEAAAIRHVAATRAIETLLICGDLEGVNVPNTLRDSQEAFAPEQPSKPVNKAYEERQAAKATSPKFTGGSVMTAPQVKPVNLLAPTISKPSKAPSKPAAPRKPAEAVKVPQDATKPQQEREEWREMLLDCCPECQSTDTFKTTMHGKPCCICKDCEHTENQYA